ncbi:hypothetical protein [Paenibacillus sp. UNC499MF]|uniref:hypothetical protein n=1 Tax=Paenibacillus sp. UNC499MF TaxID=1502751 RepID=UPI00089FBDAD|nr:hypothetical protein [Paenibacillus sp. UNC499MF]SEG56673.1 hypothetical protein SAMN02799616_03553 [Paenibacillus sp. UNC499MF]
MFILLIALTVALIALLVLERFKKISFGKNIFLLTVLTLLLTGCQNRPAEPDPKPLADYFKGEWDKIDRIDMRNGATGEVRTFKEKEILRKWIDETRIIKITADPNQEARTGFRYSANLYEGDKLKFGFTDGRIGNVHILSSELLYNQLESLFES